MKKKHLIKSLILGLALFGSIFGISSTKSTIYADDTTAQIYNSHLQSALCQALDKVPGSALYYGDFLNNAKYIPDGETGNIEKRCIDLSNSKVTDILEIIQFDLPDTCVALDLSGNNITNDNLKKIVDTLKLTKADSTYTLKEGDAGYRQGEEKKIAINEDWNTQILKVNLNNNNLDLDSLDESILNDTRFIFGIQNFTPNPTEMYTLDEVKNARYCFKSTDHNYIGTSLYYNESNTFFQDDGKVYKLFDETKLGEYKIHIGPLTDSPTGYFNNMSSFDYDLKVFTAKIDDSFWIERKSFFNLTSDKIIINGLLGDVKLKIKDAPTSQIGLIDVLVEITNIDTSRYVTLQFLVKDTIAPVINLKPYNSNILYWRQNKEFNKDTDPGYTGTDSGDDISFLVYADYSSIDITKLGTYTIKYNLTDLAGNKALEVSRVVVVQEQVLDEITLKTKTEKLIVGQEIVLTVQPSGNIDMKKYKDFVYTWYLNGEFFKTTSGDQTSGQSTTVITLDNTKEVKITVELVAKQDIDDAEIFVSSEPLTLKAELSDNSAIIIAMLGAVGIVTIVMITSLIINYRKKHKTARKTKNSPNAPKQNQDIKVIKDYKDDNKNK